MLVRDVFPVEGRGVCPCILLRTVSIVVFKIVCVFVYLVLLMLTVEAQRTWKLFPECLNNKIYKEVWHSLTLSLFSCSLVFKVFTILREEDWNWVCGKPFVLGVSDVFFLLVFLHHKVCRWNVSSLVQLDEINQNHFEEAIKCIVVLQLDILSILHQFYKYSQSVTLVPNQYFK